MILGGEKSSGSSVMDQVGENIIHHVSNSDIMHPIVHLPHIFGVDMSVTKHVLMLWIVALLVSITIIIPVRAYLKQKNFIPSGMANAIESITQFIRDSIVAPNVGSKMGKYMDTAYVNFFLFYLIC